jgi:integrase
VEWNVLDRAPKVRALREKHAYVAEDEYLTFEETTRFLEVVAPEWCTFVVVALKTGLRLGELLALQGSPGLSLLDRTEKLGDNREMAGAENENPRGDRGLD